MRQPAGRLDQPFYGWLNGATTGFRPFQRPAKYKAIFAELIEGYSLADPVTNKHFRKTFLILLAIAGLLLVADVALAQLVPSPPRRLRSPATVRGFIGGESHDSYMIRARKGQTLIVRLSWRREGDNQASFSVKESPDYYIAEPVKFGTESDNGKRWVGRIPKSGNYFIDVVAHPSAHYILRITVK